MAYLSGNRDTDFNILLWVEDDDLKNLLLNKAITSIITSDIFWQTRSQRKEKDIALSWSRYYWFIQAYPPDKDEIARSLHLNEEERYTYHQLEQDKGGANLHLFTSNSRCLITAIRVEEKEDRYITSSFPDTSSLVEIIEAGRLDVITQVFSHHRVRTSNLPAVVEQALGRIGALDYFYFIYGYVSEIKSPALTNFLIGLIEGQHNTTAKLLYSPQYRGVMVDAAINSSNDEMLSFLGEDYPSSWGEDMMFKRLLQQEDRTNAWNYHNQRSLDWISCYCFVQWKIIIRDERDIREICAKIEFTKEYTYFPAIFAQCLNYQTITTHQLKSYIGLLPTKANLARIYYAIIQRCDVNRRSDLVVALTQDLIKLGFSTIIEFIEVYPSANILYDNYNQYLLVYVLIKIEQAYPLDYAVYLQFNGYDYMCEVYNLGKGEITYQEWYDWLSNKWMERDTARLKSTNGRRIL